MSLARRPDWPERLAAYLEGRRYAPFAWGTNDCAMFAADAVLAMTDVDIARPWRGHYTNEEEAATLIESVGGMQGFARAVGLEKRAGDAVRGDLVLISMEGRDTFAVHAGNGFVAGPGARGMLFRPLTEIQIAYAV